MTLRLLLAPIPDHEPPITLAETDQARLAAIRLPRRRLQFVAGRALLAEAGVSALVVDEQGKPRGGDGQPLSLSHSRQFVAAVVGECGQRLGLDLEQPRPRRPLDALLARTLNVDMDSWQLADDAARTRLFYAGWTLREALAKADGRGLAWSLGAVAIRGDWLESGAPALTISAPQPGAGAVWQLGGAMYMALVVLGDGPLPLCQWLQPPPWPPQLLWQGQWRGQH